MSCSGAEEEAVNTSGWEGRPGKSEGPAKDRGGDPVKKAKGRNKAPGKSGSQGYAGLLILSLSPTHSASDKCYLCGM
jgi:hypothetical protein